MNIDITIDEHDKNASILMTDLPVLVPNISFTCTNNVFIIPASNVNYSLTMDQYMDIFSVLFSFFIQTYHVFNNTNTIPMQDCYKDITLMYNYTPELIHTIVKYKGIIAHECNYVPHTGFVTGMPHPVIPNLSPAKIYWIYKCVYDFMLRYVSIKA